MGSEILKWNLLLIYTLFSCGIANKITSSKLDSEIEAEEILKHANNQIETHWVKLREIFLSSGKNNSKPQYLMDQSQIKHRTFTIDLAQNLSNLLYEYPSFQNNGLKRRMKLLSHLKISGLNDVDFNRSQILLERMNNLSFERIVCSYDDDCTSQVAYLPHISNVIIRSKDDEELMYYWTAWRNAVAKNAKKAFLEYQVLYRKAAYLNHHITPSKTWYLDFEEDNFIVELAAAMAELRPLYEEFHAYMRHIYNQEYGSEKVPEDGPIPEHFMDQIISHAWKAQSLFKPPYPNNPLPNVNKKMEEDRLTSKKALEMASYFYESLGLQPLRLDFWSKYARQMTDQEAGPDCIAEVFSFPPDVAIKFCPKIDYRKYLQLHGKMAEIHYNMYRDRLPYGLNKEAFSGISNAIGEAVIVAASSHRHLESVDLMNGFNRYAAFNRLFRMGVHTIFTLPRYFAMEKFWVDSLDFEYENLNCQFWKINLQYVGVVPPEDRTEKYFDPGYKFYRGLDDNSPTTSKIISELLGYQFYRSLCLKSGQYIPGDPNFPLHNCDFYKSHEAGKALRELMSLGSSKNWRDVIETVTGERRISAKALNEYYEPLYEWLKERNQENGVGVGWTTKDMC